MCVLTLLITLYSVQRECGSICVCGGFSHKTHESGIIYGNVIHFIADPKRSNHLNLDMNQFDCVSWNVSFLSRESRNLWYRKLFLTMSVRSVLFAWKFAVLLRAKVPINSYEKCKKDCSGNPMKFHWIQYATLTSGFACKTAVLNQVHVG